MKINLPKSTVQRLLVILAEDNEGLQDIIKYYAKSNTTLFEDNARLAQQADESDYANVLVQGEVEALRARVLELETAGRLLAEENQKLTNELEW